MRKSELLLTLCSAVNAVGAIILGALYEPVVGAIVALSLGAVGSALLAIRRRQGLDETTALLRKLVDTSPFISGSGEGSEWARVLRRLGYGNGSVQEGTRRAVTRDMAALLSLHQLVSVRGETPPHAPWVALPETLLALVDSVRKLPDGAVVVDIGSGLSTVWLGLAAAAEKRGIRIVSLEHDADFAEATRGNLERQGVGSEVELRLAPLQPVTIDGSEYEWYAQSGYADLSNVHLVFVDGPPGSTSKTARYPALPLLASALVDGAVVIVDDANRADEKEIISRWSGPLIAGLNLTLERSLGNAAVLRVSRDD